MKFSAHSLIPFVPFLLSHLRMPSPELLPFLDSNWFKWSLLQLHSSSFCQLTAQSHSQSQSHIANDDQSVSKSWCRTSSGAHDQIFITVLTVTVLFFLWSALSDERTGLSFVYAAGPCQRFLGSESLGTRDHILLSQIWDFPFRCILRLAGSRWRYSTPPPHCSLGTSIYIASGRTPRKTLSSIILYGFRRVYWPLV
jgi:hypothetical protein